MTHAPRARTKSKVVQLVANPAAGGHCARTVAALADAFGRAGAEVLRSECGPACEFAIDPRADHVCAIGGDGTVRHAARAASLCGRPVGLSFFPAGTINLLHREAPGALDPEQYAAQVLRGAGARSHYAASLNDGLFLVCASVGPDSAAVASLSPRLKRRIGRAAYAIAFLGTLLRWPRRAIRLRHDAGELACEAFYVAKGRYFAGPWSFAPEARLDAPLLHVVALTRCTRRAYALFLLAMLRGRPTGAVPGAVAFTCTRLAADCDVPLPVQADGDMVASLPVEIAVRPDPIRFG